METTIPSFQFPHFSIISCIAFLSSSCPSSLDWRDHLALPLPFRFPDRRRAFFLFSTSTFSHFYPTKNPKFLSYLPNCLLCDVRTLTIPIQLWIPPSLPRVWILPLGLNPHEIIKRRFPSQLMDINFMDNARFVKFAGIKPSVRICPRRFVSVRNSLSHFGQGVNVCESDK